MLTKRQKPCIGALFFFFFPYSCFLISCALRKFSVISVNLEKGICQCGTLFFRWLWPGRSWNDCMFLWFYVRSVILIIFISLFNYSFCFRKGYMLILTYARAESVLCSSSFRVLEHFWIVISLVAWQGPEWQGKSVSRTFLHLELVFMVSKRNKCWNSWSMKLSK